MAPDALHPALHPCLNQVRLNEICSKGQIKPSQISLHDKGEKYGLGFQYLGHRKKIKKVKAIQKMTIILEGNCILHNWLQCTVSSLKVVLVRLIKDLLAWFLQFLVCNSHFPFFTK